VEAVVVDLALLDFAWYEINLRTPISDADRNVLLLWPPALIGTPREKEGSYLGKRLFCATSERYEQVDIRGTSNPGTLRI
jgi:hypothetical protein